jgi:hypothetical protein
MAVSYAIPGDVGARWRPLTDSEADTAQVLIEDASDIIRTRWTGVDAAVVSGAVPRETLRRIVCGMVRRAMVVADSAGVESQSQTAGPFSLTSKFANPTGDLYLTGADVAALDSLLGAGAAGLPVSAWMA